MRDAAGEQLLRIAREVCDALELSPHAHAVLDLDGRIVAVNATLLRWTGRAGDAALVGAPVASEDDVLVVMALTRARYGESVTLEVHEVVALPELRGSFRLHLTPVRSGSRVVGLGMMLEDIGHRSGASQTELPFRDMVDSVPVGLIVERAGVVLYANRSALSALGYSGAGELVGLSLYEIVRCGFVEELKTRLGRRESADFSRVELMRRDGRAIGVRLRTAALELSDGRASLLSFAETDPASTSVTRAEGSVMQRQTTELTRKLELALAGASERVERASAAITDAIGAGTFDEVAMALSEAIGLARELADRVRSSSPDVAATNEATHSTSGESMATVLVCDDESRLAMLTAGLLDQYGYAAVTVATGEEALAALEARAGEVDVLLLDLNLPDQSADDVLRRMREKGFRQPVILTSGYAEEDVPPQLLQDPQIAAYLAKPYSVEHLVSSVRRALSAAAGLV